MQLDHAWLLAHIPHQGSMCLLDAVTDWDGQHIRCTASSHRDADNPLRAHDRLGAACGIEYAAQAAAVHGALLRGDTLPRSGVLASLKNVIATQQWMHEIVEDIVIEANLLHSDPAGGIFAFAVFASEERILNGQFTLMYIDQAQEQRA